MKEKRRLISLSKLESFSFFNKFEPLPLFDESNQELNEQQMEISI